MTDSSNNGSERQPYAFARELHRRQMATARFLGLDAIGLSCMDAIRMVPLPRSEPPDPSALSEADKQYGEDMTAIALGKEQHGYRRER